MQPFFHPLDLFAVHEEANEGDNEGANEDTVDSTEASEASEASEAASGHEGVLEAPDVYIEKRREAKRRDEGRRSNLSVVLWDVVCCVCMCAGALCAAVCAVPPTTY